jgi:Domain of unknown function (DUF222)/HNH endonuclease
MCLPGQPIPQPAAADAAEVARARPAGAADAAAMARTALGWLAAADAGSLSTAEQADCLRVLEQAAALHTAARSRVLEAFHARGGCQDDGQGSTKAWLRWQTRITGGAAGGALGWMRRLAAHPAIRDALAAAEISESWARAVCAWTDQLPGDYRDDADRILLGAAAGGADLRDLAGLAEEIRKRTARPDAGSDDGFDDRGVRLSQTFRGAGKLAGDLTPQCSAALQAVLDALGKRAGPEDLRTKDQRQHDALEEACRRLVAAGGLPDRAGQPTQIMLQLDLDQLRGLPGAPALQAAWAHAAAGPGYDCDATVVPVVTGQVDTQVLDRLVNALLGDNRARARLLGRDGRGWDSQACDGDNGHEPGPDAAAVRRALAERAARRLILAHAASLLSGPAGLAARLRTGLLDGPAAAISLPLDIGAAAETIPAHLRRLVIARDRRCRFPGCHQPAAACQPHHIVPRSQGGPTSLTNLLLLCAFHHLIAVHRWGWGIVLLPDGTVTATSPDRTRTLHSHSPPSQAA